MPHADHALVPKEARESSEAFYEHVCEQVLALLASDEERPSWVSAFANVSSLLYHAFVALDRTVNWVGVYMNPKFFDMETSTSRLLLGPFHGRPACQYISLQGRTGVCAEAYQGWKPVLVPDVEARPGHIACDAATRSELVLPIMIDGQAVGVLDLDCEKLEGFDEADVHGLQRVLDIVVKAVAWPSSLHR